LARERKLARNSHAITPRFGEISGLGGNEEYPRSATHSLSHKVFATMILVTGGAGFIGSNFVLNWLAQSKEPVVNLDKLTYAGNRNNLAALGQDRRHVFIQGDICDAGLVGQLLANFRPRAILHFAAESHVDRSIDGPAPFITTNINGTFNLLEAARAYWLKLERRDRNAFRFLHVSTDEVYGSLRTTDRPFTESHAYAPNSPYSASKAASDHLVRAYHHTYGLPTLTTNCSNNYGPYQFPEKLVPLVITNALAGRKLPVYGDGSNIRDWLYVDDHCHAVRQVLAVGRPGQTYNIGGWNEKTNLETVRMLCDVLDRQAPRTDSRSYREQIRFVVDRPGHDRRYAIDAGKIELDLGWRPRESFSSGIAKTVAWYLANQDWVRDVQSGAYQHWIAGNYDQRRSAEETV
jgi:dTDP-glucose 4,6-dehydratase